MSSTAALQLVQSMESAQNSSAKLQGGETPIIVQQVNVDGGCIHHPMVEIAASQASLVIALEVNIYLLTVDLLRSHVIYVIRKDT